MGAAINARGGVHDGNHDEYDGRYMRECFSQGKYRH